VSRLVSVNGVLHEHNGTSWVPLGRQVGVRGVGSWNELVLNVGVGKWHDLGGLHGFQFVVPSFDDDVQPCGVIEYHMNYKTELPCGGTVTFAPGKNSNGASWDVASLDPLTITPSVWCKPPGGCGMHGFITDGRWHDAG
jgi:hypothetical protein